MDTYNWFFTKATVLHARLEYLAALAALASLVIRHVEDINWQLFAVLFFYIDVIGTVPGTLADIASHDKRTPKAYYLLYDVMHSGLTQAAAVAALCATIGWRWDYLAIPIHLCLDRGAFNNYIKPFGIRFVATRTPEFAAFQSTYAEAELSSDARPAELSGRP